MYRHLRITKFFAVVLGILTLTVLTNGCTDDEIQSRRSLTAQSIKSENTSDQSTDPAKGSQETKDAAGSDKLPGDPSSDNNVGSLDLQLKAFFDESVSPSFKTSCIECHTEPRNNPATPAPVSIYSYTAMFDLLSKGNGAYKNNLMKKVSNVIPHSGGDKCGSQLEGGPCENIATWWTMANPEKAKGSGLYVSAVEQVTDLGVIFGYAAAKNDSAATAEVSIYVGGPKETGVFLETVMANLPGNSAGVAGDHRFKYTLPDEYRDGTPKDIHIYATISTEEFELSGSPVTATSYAPKAAGRLYFDANVSALLNTNCMSCHGWDYDTVYPILLSPTPILGGTRSDNRFINMVAGENGHPRTFCDKLGNDELCQNLRTWWDEEFQN